MRRWDGVYAFPVSAMDDAGDRLDLDAHKAQVEFILDGGVHGVAPLGSTGEFAYLTPEERRAVIGATVEQVAGRVPVMAGVSAITTSQTVTHARDAQELGADALLVVLQSYFPLDEDQIFGHIEAIDRAVDLPLFLYNNPTTSKHDIEPSLVERLAELPNVQGIKESTGKVDRIMELQRVVGDRLDLFCGWEHLAFPMFCLGVRGWSTATATLVPALCTELYELAVERKDFVAALEVHNRIAPLAEFLLSRPLPATVKAGLELMGRPVGSPRRPLTPLGEPDRRTLAQLLDTAGVSVEQGVAPAG